MKQATKLFGLLMVLMWGAAFAAGDGIQVTPGVQFTFTDCAAAGSSPQTLTAGNYLLTVTDEDTWLCWAATCGSGGVRLPLGTVMKIGLGIGSGNSTQLSCRSAGSTGDANFVRGE